MRSFVNGCDLLFLCFSVREGLSVKALSASSVCSLGMPAGGSGSAISANLLYSAISAPALPGWFGGVRCNTI